MTLLSKSAEIQHLFAAIERSAAFEETLIVAVLIALIIGFAVGRRIARYQVRAIQNRGEGRLSCNVKTRFRPPDYLLLNHITLRLKDGTTTQIDHILVSRFGIFVIETKDYRGWIFADAKDRYWTQILYRTKFRFQNPIHQNYKHVCAVRDLLEFLEPDVIRPIVVFVGDAEFKPDAPDMVFTLSEFIAYVQRYRTEVMSVNRVQFCVGRLEATRLAITEATDVEHVMELRRRHGITD
ncbi:MAG: nuclease-related domain-containing protein [Stenotrophobium sp.]